MKNEITTYKINIGNIITEEITEHNLVAIETRSDTSSHIMWITKLDFFGTEICIEKNFNLSGAINEIRKRIEPKGYLLIIKWCEKDANHSGMLGSSTAGTRMYKMEEVLRANKEMDGLPPIYDVLSPTKFDKVVNLTTQEAYVQFLLDIT